LPSPLNKNHITYQIIDLDEEAFKAYSAQRWLWNEPAQLQRRFVISNLNTLPGIAEEAAGPDAICVSLTKLPEGNSNKAFLATMRAFVSILECMLSGRSKTGAKDGPLFSTDMDFDG
jgi:hypothetical protein